MPDATKKLIEAIRKFPILYNQYLKECRDNKRITAVWKMFKSKNNSDCSESFDINDFYKHFKSLTSELKLYKDVDCKDFLNDFDSHVSADSSFGELNEALILTYFLSNKNGRNNCFHANR
jgi:hypothetical protein